MDFPLFFKKRMMNTAVLRNITIFREVIKRDLKSFTRHCCTERKMQPKLASAWQFFFILEGFLNAGNRHLMWSFNYIFYIMYAVLFSLGATMADYSVDPFSLQNKWKVSDISHLQLVWKSYLSYFDYSLQD